MIERREDRPCVACGEPIGAGQAYVTDGPLHVYCGLPLPLNVAEWWGSLTLDEGPEPV